MRNFPEITDIKEIMIETGKAKSLVRRRAGLFQFKFSLLGVSQETRFQLENLKIEVEKVLAGIEIMQSLKIDVNGNEAESSVFIEF